MSKWVPTTITTDPGALNYVWTGEERERERGKMGVERKGRKDKPHTHTHVRKNSQDFRIDHVLKTNVVIKCILYSGAVKTKESLST